MVNTKYLKIFLLILFFIDSVFTYLQMYHSMFIDGDLIGIVVPSPDYQKVLNDPLAFNVILNNEIYPAPNRFFAHFFLKTTFDHLPIIVQNFFDPIDSLYISMALSRILIQVILIGLLSLWIIKITSLNRKYRIKFSDLIIPAIIITPLFQIYGYGDEMGITYSSIAYTFFYSLPLIFILLYFLPFYRNKSFSIVVHVSLIVIAFVIAFGGPIGAPVAIIICFSVLLYKFFIELLKPDVKLKTSIKNFVKNLDKNLLFHFSLIIVLCLYSFYVGKFNTENLWYTKPIAERYDLMKIGFWIIMTKKLGPGLLLILIVINSILIKRMDNDKTKFILTLVQWTGIACLLYILLLPLGGFRGYRPLIIRADTFVPVSLSLVFLYGLTICYLIFNSKSKIQWIMILVACIITLIYTNSDKRIIIGLNQCERQALTTIAQSESEIVELRGYWCNVLAWEKYYDYKRSQLASQMLVRWRITDKKKLYYLSD